MSSSIKKLRLAVPLLAFVLACAMAPMAFAAQGGIAAGSTDLPTTSKLVAQADPIDISGAVVDVDDQVYTGDALEPDPTVKIGDDVLKAGTDYTVDYDSNKNVGTAKVTVTGRGDYEGTAMATFTISPAPASKMDIANIPQVTYNGSAFTPEPKVTFSGDVLKKNTDYTVAYKSNVNAGKAQVVITGKGNFTGTKAETFTIAPAAISKAAVAAIAKKTYTGKAFTPAPKVTFGGKTLKKNTDYTVAYKSNVKAGKAQVIITGKGNYTGTKTVKFTIVKAAISKAKAAKIKNKTYTGAAIKPVPVLKYKGKKLKKGTDFTLKYKNNKKVGTATITITGKGNFKGKKTVKFKIVKANIGKAKTSKVKDYEFTTRQIKPKPKVKFKGKTLKNGRDYTLTYKSNVNVGTAKIIIKGKGNFKGTKTVKFKITKGQLSSAQLYAISPQYYTGSSVEPNPKLVYKGKTLKKDLDYSVSYSNNVERGTATATIYGKNNFEGTRSATFAIVQRNLADPKATVSKIVPQKHTGLPIEPTPFVRASGKLLTRNVDYKLTYDDNVSVGTATIYIDGIGNYTGRLPVYFKIVDTNANKAAV